MVFAVCVSAWEKEEIVEEKERLDHLPSQELKNSLITAFQCVIYLNLFDAKYYKEHRLKLRKCPFVSAAVDYSGTNASKSLTWFENWLISSYLDQLSSTLIVKIKIFVLTEN